MRSRLVVPIEILKMSVKSDNPSSSSSIIMIIDGGRLDRSYSLTPPPAPQVQPNDPRWQRGAGGFAFVPAGAAGGGQIWRELTLRRAFSYHT